MARIKGEPDPRAYSEFGRKVAALLGANSDWTNDPGGLLDTINEFAEQEDIPDINDYDQQEELWRPVADELGLGYE